jgi:hypothetical protein
MDSTLRSLRLEMTQSLKLHLKLVCAQLINSASRSFPARPAQTK